MNRLLTILAGLAAFGLATAPAQAGGCCCVKKLKLCCVQPNAFSPYCCQPCLGGCCAHPYCIDAGCLACCNAPCCGPACFACGDAGCLGCLPPSGTTPGTMPGTTAPPPAAGAPSYSPPPPAPLDNMGNPISYYPAPLGYPANYGLVQPAAFGYVPYPAYAPQACAPGWWSAYGYPYAVNAYLPGPRH